MRLVIGKDGKVLNLRRGTALQLDLQSPVYFGTRDPNVIPGVKAYSLSIPNDAHNRKLLGRPDLLDNPEAFLEEEGWEVRYDGLLILTGRMEVESGRRESDFNITIIGGLSGNLYALKETYLFDLDLGGLIDAGETTDDVLSHATLVASDPDNYGYLFPQIKTAANPAYDEAGIPTQYEYCNRYNGGYKRIILVEDPAIYSSLIPMLKIQYLLQQAFAAVGFGMSGVFEGSEYKEELQNLILFNNITLDKASDSVDGPLTFADLELNTTIDLTQHVPQIKVNDFIRRIINTFAWALFIDTVNHQVSIKPYQDLIKGKAFTNWTTKVDPNYNRQRPVEDFPQRFSYDHTSNDEYAEEYQLRLLGRQIISYDTYDQAKAGLTTDDIGKAIYIESLNEYFDLLGFRPPGNSPIMLTIGKSLGIINEFEEPDYDPGTDTLHMLTRAVKTGDTNSVFFSGNEYLPVYYGDLVSPWFEGTKKNDLILLLYRGFQTIGLGQYPLASSGAYNFDEEKVGELSLLWTGEEGLYNRWWKTWLEAIARFRPVVYPTRLRASDIARLDFSKKVRIDQHEYLIKRVQVTLTTEEIQTARVEYMQIL